MNLIRGNSDNNLKGITQGSTFQPDCTLIPISDTDWELIQTIMPLHSDAGEDRYAFCLPSENPMITLSTGECLKEIEPILPGYIHFKIAQAAGTIYFQADGIPLLSNSAADILSIRAELHESQDPASPLIPLAQAWPIRMRDEARNAAFIRIIPPQAPGIYAIDLSFEGKPAIRYRLYDDDFAIIAEGGNRYRLQMVTPLIIDVYEA
jgi:hypothetical protein